MTDPQPLVVPACRIGCRMPVEVALVGGHGDAVRLLDDDLASRHQHLVERQRRDIGAARSPQRVAAWCERASIAAALARSLHQRDLTVAQALERGADLDQRSGDETCCRDQGARRHWPSVDVHEVRWRRVEHTAEQITHRDRFVNGVDRDLCLALRCRNDQIHGFGRDGRCWMGSGTDTGLMILLSARQFHEITPKFTTTSSSRPGDVAVPTPRIDER
jgi:hypothetical protein